MNGVGTTSSSSGEPNPSSASASPPETDRTAPLPDRRLLPKKRSIDFMLEGESVKTNRHLARFAASPYLLRLINDERMSPMLNRGGRSLRKELIEGYSCLERAEALIGRTYSGGVSDVASSRDKSGRGENTTSSDCDDNEQGGDAMVSSESGGGGEDPAVVVDLCSGKGYLSVILACEFPNTQVLMIDNNRRLKTEHVESFPNLTFWHADVMAEDFAGRLGEEINRLASASGRPDGKVFMAGMHLCGSLSPRAVSLYSTLRTVDALILAPCCLHKKFDAELKEAAKAAGRDPFYAKVDQLKNMLTSCAEEVGVHYDEAFRTNKKGGVVEEGGVGCKNALIVGLGRRDPSNTAGGGAGELYGCQPCKVDG